MAADFEQLAEELKTGDTAAARETLRSAQAAAADASDNTTGPGWWLTRALPGVGDDVVAVRTVADVTDVLAADVLPSVVTASETLDPAALRPKNGRVRLQPLIDVAPSVVRADEQLQEQVDRVAELRPVDLNPQLAEPVSLMQDKLGEAASLSSKASYALRLLPTMLGAEGPRTYLVLFQNNAEVRATGGIPGAFATITADDGRIALGAQGSAADIGMLEKPPLPLTEEELALFQEKMGLFAQNVNFTPDFPRTAELARAMWESKSGRSVDGVVSTDPVALSYLLGGTGPVRIGAGQTLTADNAVQLLLNEIYLEQPDPLRQNLFFAQAARAVFEAVSSGQGDPPAVLDGLARAGSESRLLVWSADEEEQRLLDETALSGRLPDRAGAAPYVGVFLNDGTGAKMQYYLDHEVEVLPTGCNSEGRQRLRVSVRLRSTAPANARELPVSVIGPGFGAAPGAMRMSVFLYAPIGGWIDASTVDGQEAPLAELDHQGHPVGVRTVDLAPGQVRTLSYDVVSGTDQPASPTLRVTPGVHGTGVGQVGASLCN